MDGAAWICRGRRLDLKDRPRIMGILNVTPDSFSDGGRFATPDAAIARGRELAAWGADIVDVGGESTRPGAMPVAADEEIRRIVPVIRALARDTQVLISVDTMKASVAREALEAGAHILNDVSACTADPAMADLARSAGAGVILMHMQGTPRTMQDNPHYEDVVGEVAAYLGQRIEALRQQGLDPATLAVDPGIGFGKTAEHNLQLLKGLPKLAALGRPVVVGLSRKRFIGAVTGAPVEERLAGSLAGLVYAALRGGGVFRVHDVKESRQALDLVQALERQAP